MTDDYKISDNFNGVAGSKVMSPHHSHPTNGVRPSDSTDQPGAGTVDWSSPEGEGHSHIRDDVKPFEDARYLESVCGLSGCINKYYEVRPSW